MRCLQPELLSVSGRGAINKKPRPVCAGGVWNRVCSGPYGALPTTTTTRTTTAAAGSAVFSRVEVIMEGVIRDLFIISSVNLYKHRLQDLTMENNSST